MQQSKQSDRPSLTELSELVNTVQKKLYENERRAAKDKPTWKTLMKRMVDHIRANLIVDVDSGYDTNLINVEISYIFLAILEDAEQRHVEPEATVVVPNDAAPIGDTPVKSAKEPDFPTLQKRLGVKIGCAALVIETIADKDTSVDLSVAML